MSKFYKKYFLSKHFIANGKLQQKFRLALSNGGAVGVVRVQPKTMPCRHPININDLAILVLFAAFVFIAKFGTLFFAEFGDVVLNFK